MTTPTRRQPIKAFYLNKNTEGTDEKEGVFSILPSSADDILNLHMTKDGYWTPQNKGYSILTSVLSSSLLNTFFYKNADDGREYIIYTYTGGVGAYNLTDNTNSPTLTTTLFKGFGYYSQFRGKAILTSSAYEPCEWAPSGSLIAVANFPITNGAFSYNKPVYTSVYSNRLVYANFSSNTSLLVISDLLEYNTFTFAGSAATRAVAIDVSPGDGQSIVGIKNLYIPNQNKEYLVIFKDSSTYLLGGTTADDFNIIKLDSSLPAISHNGITQVGNDLIYLGSDNIYSMSASINDGNLKTNTLTSRKISEQYADINLAQAVNAWSIYIPSLEEIWVGFPSGSMVVADKILVGKRNSVNEEWVWSRKTSITLPKPALTFKNTLYSGDSLGNINRWFNNAQYGTVDYNWSYTYPFYDFNSLAQFKAVRHLEVWLFINSDCTFSLTANWRQGKGLKVCQRTITLQVPSARYGSAIFGQSIYNTSSNRLLKVKVPITGNGQQLQLKISGNTVNSMPVFLGMSGLVEFGAFAHSAY